ncbi:MAG: response regulator transcription factor [Saprospiraceae bacterium]|nr:response regulator transcription factor [Candidatus Vicinibacter affinis]MBP7305889.1 response regulator transcription factor [Saprospiraceae bacterium]MBK6571528.1 response regulator transcription factor [Candidatus Vicinibacter affinis]MBK6821817.1 response regulator transcription factor [Candidatus Vicinibacter affinis]MBK7800316.1 response regulator transcription factor [Candidatus Vicinibacter affinis]
MKSRILIIANQGDPTFNIVQIIEQSLSEIVTIENAVSIWDAKIKIREFDPDVLIVDIDIEEEVITLEFLQNILYKKFKIIIIAGQPDHAIDAFKIQALDFLLKPVNPLSLTSAIQRAIEHKLIKSRLTEFQHPFIGSSHSLRVLPNKISLYSEGKMIFVEPTDLLYFKAEGSYTNAVLRDGKKLLISRNIGFLESRLNHQEFIRAHRSYIININYIDSLRKKHSGAELKIGGQLELDISRECVNLLLPMLDPNFEHE